MTAIFEAHFSQIKEMLQEHKDSIIKAIVIEKDKEIAALKGDLNRRSE
jgi:hypothetical protein